MAESLPPGMASLYNFGAASYRARLAKEGNYFKWLIHCMPPSAITDFEKNQPTNEPLSIETRVFSLAAGYASAKISAALDYRMLRGHAFREADQSEQLFWVSIYFSAGANYGRKAMAAHDSPASGGWNTKPAAYGKDVNPHAPMSYVGNPYWYAVRSVASSELLEEK